MQQNEPRPEPADDRRIQDALTDPLFDQLLGDDSRTLPLSEAQGGATAENPHQRTLPMEALPQHEGQSTDLDLFAGMGTLPVSGDEAPTPEGFLAVGQGIDLNGKPYQVMQKLGKQTGESQVFLLNNTEGEPVVMKYYFPGFHPKMHILQDLMGIRHAGIIRILDAGYFRNQFFELLEYAAGGDLLTYAPIRDLNILRLIVAETAEALWFCHQHQIVHRDIKPDNLFFKTEQHNQIVLGDFGISSKIADDDLNQLTSQSRTPIYAAPEVYQSIAGKTVVQPAVDWYSLGMTLLYLWTGRSPFKGMNEFQIMQAKSQGLIQPPPDMPADLARLIKGLLTLRTVRRWGYDQIQRWLAGEQVPVDESQPLLTLKPFKFGSDHHGKPLEAADPAELARFLRAYPEKGAQFLHSGAIKNWLEQSGEQELALEVSAICEQFSESRAVKVVVYVLDPTLPLLLEGRAASDPVSLAQWIYGSEADWGEQWPASYHAGLELLESGELLAWLKARGHHAMVRAWADLGLPAASTKGLESLLRIMDPQLPPVWVTIDASPLLQRRRLLPGQIQDLPLSYSTKGRGVPRAEMALYSGARRRQFQLLNARQGSFHLKLGDPDDSAYRTYQLRLEIAPDASTLVEGSSWNLSYKVRYPWHKVGKSLFAATAVGAAAGLGVRAALYKYPKPMSSYFKTSLTPAQAKAHKDPYLDYAFCGGIVAVLLVLNWLVRL